MIISSELRSHELLHVVDKKVLSDITDEKMLEEQSFKARSILINHLEPQYYSKVMHLKNPGEILEKF